MKNKQFIYTEKDAEKMFFTSDTHFCHENIIKYCKRPFANIAENDEEIIRRWNEKVPEDGIVFHLGDVAFGDPERVDNILERLNGTIYLVIGNHDWRRVVNNHKWRFEMMTQQINMKIGKRHIILNHYPMLPFTSRSVMVVMFSATLISGSTTMKHAASTGSSPLFSSVMVSL